MTTKIKYYDIPLWLKDSDFYRNLSSDEPDIQIEIPTKCFRLTDDCAEMEDVANVLETMRFWAVPRIPDSLLEFCFVHGTTKLDENVPEIPEHEALRKAFKHPNLFSLEVAVATARHEFEYFWLKKNKPNSKHGVKAITHACRFGRLDLVQTLRERGFHWGTLSYCAAAQYGHLNTLKYLHDNKCTFLDYTPMQFAARGGQLECMKYLHSIGCEWDIDVTREFAVREYFLQFESDEEDPWTDDFTLPPPVNGYMDCLHYALENGCPIHEHACSRACEYGLLDCLKLLHQHNAPWSTDCTYLAAENGHLDCLQYLHENGCPWKRNAVEVAEYNDHTLCLEYLRIHGCEVLTGNANKGSLICG